MLNRVDALRAVIGEYEEERSLTVTRRDKYALRRAQIELARELLLEHGQIAEAEHLLPQLHDLDRHIGATEELLARLDGLIAMFRASLRRIETAS